MTVLTKLLNATDLAVVTTQELLLEKLPDGPHLRKLSWVFNGEICNERLAKTSQGLACFAADGDEFDFAFQIRIDQLLDEVRVQSTTKTFVCCDDQNERLLPLPLDEKGMGTLFCIFLEADKNLVHQPRIGTPTGCLILGLFHLSSRDELHGLGDLGRAFDRLDSASDVAGAWHDLKLEISGVKQAGLISRSP